MRRGIIILCLWASVSMPALGQDVAYQIKAAYIYNFLQFITFDNPKNGGAPHLDVCVVDEYRRFGDALDHIAGQSTPQGEIKIIQLSRFSTQKIASCHVLYLVDSETKYAQSVLKKVDTSRVLTIGESKNFIPRGGFIELFIQDDSVRFRINSNLAGHTQFKVSSQLLSLGVKS